MSDPFELPFWNLLQIVAWIYLRDRSLVRDMADEQRDRGKIWVWERTAEGEKRVNVRRPAPSFMELSVKGHSEDSRHYPNLTRAKEALSVELQNGSLTFFGAKNGRGELEAIPAEQWSDLCFYDDPLLVAPKDYSRRGVVRWLKVRGRREEVLAIWPDKLAEAGEAGIIRAPAVSPTSFSRGKVTKWYKKRVADWKAGNPIPSQDEDVEDAKDEISEKVTRAFVRGLRHKHAPAAWNVTELGPKPKPPSK